jgi:ABC-type multidrug transport system permease subunit
MTPGLRSSVSVALGIAWRTLHNVFTTPSLIIPSVLFPLFFFTAFAGGLAQVSHLPGFDFPSGYTAFQFVFVLFQSAAFQGVFIGFTIARDFEYGFARRLFIAAPHRSAIVAGYALASIGRWAFTITVLTVIALLSHMQVGGNGIDLVTLYALGLVVNQAGLLWAAGVAMRFRTMQAGPIMQLPVFLILFFAPVYVPLSFLSGWLHGVAVVNPITRLLEAGRGLIDGHPTEVGLAFAAAFGLVLVFLIWTLRGVRDAEAAGAA